MMKRMAGVFLLMSLLSASGYVGEDSAIQLKQQELAEILKPDLGLVFSLMGDNNDISFYQIGGEGSVWLTPAIPLRVQYFTGEIEQDSSSDGSIPETKFDRDALSVIIDEYQFTPQLSLNGRYTYEEFDVGEVSGGEVGLMFKDEGNSKYKILARRESFWTTHDTRTPRQYLRLFDLSLIPQDFSIDTVKGVIDWVTTYEQEFHLEASFSDFEDDNELFTFYMHYQIPLPWGGTPDRWLVLRPNVYYESFSDEVAGYYSPEYHTTLGLGAHMVRKYAGGKVFELEVVPLWVFRQEDIPGKDDEYEFGVQGIADLIVPIGRFDFGIGAFGVYETDEYWLWRVSGKLMYNF
jgi:hypothetical protein